MNSVVVQNTVVPRDLNNLGKHVQTVDCKKAERKALKMVRGTKVGCVCMFMCMYLLVCMYDYMFIHMRACLCVYMFMGMCTFDCVFVSINALCSMDTYAHARLSCIHTYIGTYRWKNIPI